MNWLLSLCVSVLSLRILGRQSCGLQIAFYVFLSNLHDFGLFSSCIVLARTSVVSNRRGESRHPCEELRSFLVECDVSCRV